MQGEPERLILVAGAGIGGLTLAASLRERGIEVRVFERQPVLEPVGAGLILLPNGVMALRRVQLDRVVAEEGVEIERASILRADGTVLSGVQTRRITRDLGAPVVAIHRAALHGVLSNAVGRGPLRLGTRVLAFAERGGGVTIETEGGGRWSGSALVGADGIWSVVRRQLRGDDDLRYSGYTAWRGICSRNDVPVANEVTEIWGRGCRFGFMPVSDSAIYWFAVDNAPPGETDPPGTTKRRLAERFSGFCGPVPLLLEATPKPSVIRTDIYDRPPVRRWGSGRVTLLGDAAHPMTPDQGQGANQAMEDAIALVDLISRSASIASAFRSYERIRSVRTAPIVRLSRRFGRIGQWEGRLACRLRDTLIGAIPDWAQVRPVRRLWRLELPD